MENTINQRVTVLRKSLNMNIEDFVKSANISRTTYWNIENGKEIQPKTLKSICEGLNVSMEWLKTGTGEMFSQAKEIPLVYNPYRDALINEQKEEIEFLRKLILNLTGQKVANFHEACDLGSLYIEKSITSVRAVA